jgi:hypothetical protein
VKILELVTGHYSAAGEQAAQMKTNEAPTVALSLPCTLHVKTQPTLLLFSTRQN